ncbi:MAG: UPF0280 family protein [Dehalococcoidales bacterium]|nr:UPF0280 family protein [Dehalococcoidales bacterium]
MYQPRSYRHWIRDTDLVTFNVVVGETDLYLSAETNLKRKALRLVKKYRDTLEGYIERHPAFRDSLEALPVDEAAPHIVKAMMVAAARAGVGPMAAVAGAIAEFVGRELLAFSPEVIVENGGDIYLKSPKKRVVGIYAGDSPLTGQIGLEIEGAATPLGICTSSGTVGHSLSHGRADAVIALAGSAALADAAATAIGNLVKRPDDIAGGLERARGIEELKGVVIIVGGDIGFSGEVKLCRTSPQAGKPPVFSASG